MRNAKLLLLSAVTAISALGCTIQSRNGIKEVPYDYSDYAYYDKPFATSPDYRQAETAAIPARSLPATSPASTAPKAAPASVSAGVHRTHAAHAASMLTDDPRAETKAIR
jgi:hypothetical protein